MIAMERAELVCRLARAAGFERVGIAPAGVVGHAAYLGAWLERGWAGEMEYLSRWREVRVDPRRLLEGARSVVVVAHVYGHEGERGGVGEGGTEGHGDAETRGQRDGGTAGRGDGETERHGDRGARGRGDGGRGRAGVGERGRGGEGVAGSSEIRHPKSEIGRVAQYAWGRDYHRVMRKKLHELVDELRRELSEPFEARVCVDTAPVLEREWAAVAGVGWIGKNTLAIHARLGSFFFLGEVITTLELAPSAPAVDRCGTCTRCLEACPTGALVAPYQMDARRCISYLTIEHRSEIPAELRGMMGDWLYGCDVCQEVCPYNRKAPRTREVAYELGGNPLTPRADVERVMNMTEEQYREALAGSAMTRARLEMLKRNAGIVRDNKRDNAE